MMLESGIPRRLTVRYLVEARFVLSYFELERLLTFQGYWPYAESNQHLKEGDKERDYPVVEPIPRSAYEDSPVVGMS